jgi:hypothetical protein
MMMSDVIWCWGGTERGRDGVLSEHQEQEEEQEEDASLAEQVTEEEALAALPACLPGGLQRQDACAPQ